jgi:hypothetical protein
MDWRGRFALGVAVGSWGSKDRSRASGSDGWRCWSWEVSVVSMDGFPIFEREVEGGKVCG